MKKKIVCLLCALLVISCCVALPGCAEEQPTASEVALCDFEEYSPDFEMLRFVNKFGAIEVNEDAEFVKSGSASAKVMPLGSFSANTSPMFYIPFTSVTHNYDYKDLRMVDYITVSIYNAQQEQKEIYSGYMFARNGSKFLQQNVIRLNPGWNDITLDPSLDTMNLSYDVTECFGLYFSFENVAYQKTESLKDAPVYYFDDVVLHLSPEAQTIHEDIVVLEQDEYCNFERAWQEAAMRFSNPMHGTLQVVGEKDGIVPSSGARMLEVSLQPVEDWAVVTSVTKIKECLDMQKYRENYEDWAFAFDIYNPSDTSVHISLQLKWGEGSAWGADRDSWSFTAAPGEWTTCRVDLATVNKADTTKAPAEGGEVTFGKALTDGFTASVEFGASDNEQIVYLDYFRFEEII